MSNIYNRYFIFSKTQMEQMLKIAKSRGSDNPEFGKVIVNGSPKIYTNITLSTDNLRYSDSKILIGGDIRNIKYTDPDMVLL